MGIPHHSDSEMNEEQERALRRILAEMSGKADREWPDGRISADDDGESAYAIAADPEHGIVRIQFTKPMKWLGLDLKSAETLKDALEQKIDELRPYVRT